MATPVVMPKLGMSMQEGTVVDWPLAAGERVEKGQTLLVIESEKAEVEIEATASGFFRHMYVPEGETVPCGKLLAAITETPDEDFDVDAFREANDRPEAIVSAAGAAAPTPSPTAAPAGRARAGSRAAVTPAARKRAKQLDLDPSSIAGTGPGGRVTREDVDAFAERRKRLVEVAPGVALEAPSEGPDSDPVVLLPGFGTDVSAFARQSPVLAEKRRVTGVNPRGVGLSDAPEADVYSVAEAAEDASALVGAPAHVIGASLGAAIAVELAIAHPENVRSLTLITPFIEAGPRLLAVLASWCELAACAPAESLARALLPWLFSPAFLADERAAARSMRGLTATVSRAPAATLERSAAGLRAWSGSRAGDLAKIAVPTLVIAAGGDLLTPDAEDVAAAIPGAKCTIVPDAGHAVGLEAPDAVNEAIRQHLDDAG